MINLTVLVVIGLFFLYTAGRRFMRPPEVESLTMLIGGDQCLRGGSPFDAAPLPKSWNEPKHSCRVYSPLRRHACHRQRHRRGAAHPVLWGVLGRPGPDITIAVYVLVHGYVELRETIALLMESAPSDFNYEAMTRALQAIEGVQDLHHVHVWRLDEKRLALEAHLVLQGTDTLETAAARKRQAKHLLQRDFEIDHATLELDAGPDPKHQATKIPDE